MRIRSYLDPLLAIVVLAAAVSMIALVVTGASNLMAMDIEALSYAPVGRAG